MKFVRECDNRVCVCVLVSKIEVVFLPVQKNFELPEEVLSEGNNCGKIIFSRSKRNNSNRSYTNNERVPHKNEIFHEEKQNESHKMFFFLPCR